MVNPRWGEVLQQVHMDVLHRGLKHLVTRRGVGRRRHMLALKSRVLLDEELFPVFVETHHATSRQPGHRAAK